MELHLMILLYNGMKLQQSFGVRDVKDGVGERERERACVHGHDLKPAVAHALAARCAHLS